MTIEKSVRLGGEAVRNTILALSTSEDLSKETSCVRLYVAQKEEERDD
jgi:hypothetical protein